tara:strand:- start:1578 stop:2006 length:429 start_codon:yes stop_codon:yes gene_type:complete
MALRKNLSAAWRSRPGDIGLKHFAFVINRAPGIVKLAVYLYENLVQVSPPLGVGSHRRASFLADLCREHWPEPVPPEAHRFMRDVDAPFVEQILHVSQRERETDENHHGQADDLGRSLKIFERITHLEKLGNYRSALKAKFL